MPVESRWPDDATWLSLLRPALSNDPVLADTVAWLFQFLIENVRAGGIQAQCALSSLEDGLRLTYQFTQEHKAAYELYRLYLGGHLRAEDEPLSLVTSGIERARQPAAAAAAQVPINSARRTARRRLLKRRAPRYEQGL